MQNNYKIKLNIILKKFFMNKLQKYFLGVKYKIFSNKNFMFYTLSTIILIIYSFNLLSNYSILVNFYFNNIFFFLF